MNWLRRVLGLPEVHRARDAEMFDNAVEAGKAYVRETYFSGESQELQELRSHLLDLQQGRRSAIHRYNEDIRGGFLSLAERDKGVVTNIEQRISKVEKQIAKLEGSGKSDI